ncbi:TPA: restriction endonuclease subunit M, partial [Escherichia coli]
MSDITIPYPEAVNGHTDVICSTDIRHVVTVRNEALQQTERVIRQLAEISAMTESIG